MQLTTMYLSPIGFVQNGVRQEISSREWGKLMSKIVILPEFEEDLKDIEFSPTPFIIVVFWMDRANRSARAPGSLATCLPNRPNPIGLTIVKLLGRQANVLEVQGLDCFDGTPVLDLKPYKPWSLNRLSHSQHKIPDINLPKPG